jgi:hypothetical protein
MSCGSCYQQQQRFDSMDSRRTRCVGFVWSKSSTSVAPLERRGLKPLDERRLSGMGTHTHTRGYIALRNFPSSFMAARRRQQYMVCTTRQAAVIPIVTHFYDKEIMRIIGDARRELTPCAAGCGRCFSWTGGAARTPRCTTAKARPRAYWEENVCPPAVVFVKELSKAETAKSRGQRKLWLEPNPNRPGDHLLAASVDHIFYGVFDLPSTARNAQKRTWGGGGGGVGGQGGGLGFSKCKLRIVFGGQLFCKTFVF